MDSQLLVIGTSVITVGTALVAAAIVLVVLVLALVILVVRGNRRRLEEAAQLATDGLRANFVQQLAERDQRLQAMQARLDEEVKARAGLQADAAALTAQMAEKDKQNAENLARFQEARQQMTDEFKLIAGEVLKSHGETFSKQNKEQVDVLLKPLNDKIIEFQNGLSKDRAELSQWIRHLSEHSLKISTDANNLTRALKGSSQAQGAWGEMILSTILERSGLREGEQYRTQQSHTADDGSRLRTDVEVFMPNGDVLVVDSKVSLVAFEAYANATDETEKAQHLRDHVASMRGHIKTLSGKDYHRHANSGLDFVLMFVPVEAAFALASSADPGLIEYAIGQGVAVTTPTTLMSALRTIRNVWDIEKRHQNAEAIAERAGLLYDKVAGFVSSMDALGKNLGRAQQSFDEARGQLSEGRGNVLGQVEKLRELGAKSSKSLPAGWEATPDEDARNLIESGERRPGGDA